MPRHYGVEVIGSKIKKRRLSDREINIDVFTNPPKYLERLPLQKIVADTKVYRQGVERYKEKIVILRNGERLEEASMIACSRGAQKSHLTDRQRALDL